MYKIPHILAILISGVLQQFLIEALEVVFDGLRDLFVETAFFSANSLCCFASACSALSITLLALVALAFGFEGVVEGGRVLRLATMIVDPPERERTARGFSRNKARLPNG